MGPGRTLLTISLMSLLTALEAQSPEDYPSNGTVSICPYYDECTSCTSSTSDCGWCATSASCVPGTSSGPNSGWCAYNDWKFSTADCCGSQTTCNSCVSANGCGWCGDSSTCLYGSFAGPTTGTCLQSWNVYSSNCQDSCSIYTSCSSCTAASECGWCADTRQCKSGTSSGPSGYGYCSNWDYHSSSCCECSNEETVVTECASGYSETGHWCTPPYGEYQCCGDKCCSGAEGWEIATCVLVPCVVVLVCVLCCCAFRKPKRRSGSGEHTQLLVNSKQSYV
eukprot:c11547_g1_i1.p1 GENE.c11547_g1_i1~~c11547_g1_i1.p1  ORF type:complete len:280 (-),score=47.21 c11547_g1_i1:155-994(-)